MHIGAKRKKEK